MMSAKKDISGQRFGRTIALSVSSVGKNKSTKWLCVCDCGNQHVSYSSNLIRGVTKSCGCLKAEMSVSSNIVHGASCKRNGKNVTGAYSSWMSMRQRCRNIKNKAFHNYGGRGIKICSRWDDYKNFLEDMGERPEGYELDRIDVNGNYEPENCRWATIIQQARNKRSTALKTLNGVTKPMVQWAEEYGISEKTLRSRLVYGWSFEDALKRSKVHNGGKTKKVVYVDGGEL